MMLTSCSKMMGTMILSNDMVREGKNCTIRVKIGEFTTVERVSNYNINNTIITKVRNYKIQLTIKQVSIIICWHNYRHNV